MSKKLLLFLLLTLVVSALTSAQYQPGSPWPKFQADNANTGQGIATPFSGHLKWQVNLKDRFGVADSFSGSPVVAANGTVIVCGSGATVYGLGPTGSVLWVCPISRNVFDPGIPLVGSPVIGADGTIYVADVDGDVSALTLSGSFLWTWFAPFGTTTAGFLSIGTDGTIYLESSVGLCFP